MLRQLYQFNSMDIVARKKSLTYDNVIRRSDLQKTMASELRKSASYRSI